MKDIDMELNIEQLMQQGLSAHQAGKLQEAEHYYKTILQTQSTHPHANHNLGALYVSINKSEIALNLFKKALQVNPNIEQFWMSYISTLINERQLTDAKQALKKAKRKGVNKNKLNELNQQLILQANGTSPPQSDIDRLVKYYKDGNYDDAETLAKSITQQFPKHPFGWKILGDVFMKIDKTHEALTANKKVVELDSQDEEGYNNLGVILKKLDRLEEAEKNFRKAIVIKSQFSPAHRNLASTLKDLDKLEEAAISYKNFIALEPDNIEAHSSLGFILYSNGDKDGSIKILEKGYDIDPNSNINNVCLKILTAKKAQEEKEVKIGNKNKIVCGIKLTSNPLILNRAVEAELIYRLQEMNSRELNQTKDARYGNGRCSPDFEMFNDEHPIIKTVAKDLINIMTQAVNSKIHIYDSFFNIIGSGGGTTPHNHLTYIDKDKNINFGKQKYSLVYYLSIGDQNCSEPGILKLYNSNQDILPTEGMIVIIPADRMHSAIYNGKKDRIMIGINFYSL